MTKAMPFLQKCDITFLRPPAICDSPFFAVSHLMQVEQGV